MHPKSWCTAVAGVARLMQLEGKASSLGGGASKSCPGREAQLWGQTLQNWRPGWGGGCWEAQREGGLGLKGRLCVQASQPATGAGGTRGDTVPPAVSLPALGPRRRRAAAASQRRRGCAEPCWVPVLPCYL